MSYIAAINSGCVVAGDTLAMIESASGREHGYLLQMPHQDFYVFLIRFFNRFFGIGNYLPYAFMNLACVGVIVATVAKITDAVFKDNKTTVILLLLMAAFFPFAYTLHSCFNDWPALACFLVALCVFISKVDSKKFWCAVICVLFSILAILFKGTFLIYVLFWMLWGFLSFVSNRKISHFAMPVLCFASALFAQEQFIRFYEARYMPDFAKNRADAIREQVASEANRNEIPDRRKFPRLPKACWVAMGLQSDRFDPENGRTVDHVTSPKSLNGKWCGTWNAFVLHGRGELSEEALKARARESVGKSFLGFARDPLYAAHFSIRKIAVLWVTPPLSDMALIKGRLCFWAYDFAWDVGNANAAGRFFFDKDGLGHSGIRNVYEGWKFLVFLFSAVGFFLLFRDRKSIPNPFVPLLATIPLCGFFFYLFWEVLPRYAIPMLLPLAIVAAYGIARCSEADPRKAISRIFSRRQRGQ
ncbi:MAG: hypothetical protein LBG65_06815 [Puniceicoccales bacterium]|nr:hypothetical protein [Puniceicoccales bacterium]